VGEWPGQISTVVSHPIENLAQPEANTVQQGHSALTTAHSARLFPLKLLKLCGHCA